MVSKLNGIESECAVHRTRLQLGPSDRVGAMRTFARASAAAEALGLRRRGAQVRIVAPDAAAVAAIGPDLFTSGRRGQVEAAGFAQGRALGAAT